MEEGESALLVYIFLLVYERKYRFRRDKFSLSQKYEKIIEKL